MISQTAVAISRAPSAFRPKRYRVTGAFHPSRTSGWRTRGISARYTLRSAAALRAVDVMPIGVIVLDQNGAVIEANRSARAVLEAGEGLIAANGGLAVDIDGRQLKLRELITRTEKQATA